MLRCLRLERAWAKGQDNLPKNQSKLKVKNYDTIPLLSETLKQLMCILRGGLEDGQPSPRLKKLVYTRRE